MRSWGWRSGLVFGARLLMLAQLVVGGVLVFGAAAAAGAGLYPGEPVVADASAFQGKCFEGCGGVIAVNPSTGAETALSDNLMAINAQSQFMGAPFTLALDPGGDIIVGETAGLGGSCPSSLLCGGLVKVDPATGKQTLLSSNTMPINANSQYFGQVNGVAINHAGQIFVSDWGGCMSCGKVIEVNPTNGKETLISSNTMPINAGSQFLQYPQGLTLDKNGTIYVADALAFGKGGGIVEVNPSTGKQTELSSNELPVNASSQYFTGVGGLVFDSAGDILAADWGGGHNPGEIIEVDPSTGKESIFSSNTMPVNASSQYFNQPVGITIDQNGNVYVADEGAFCTLGCGGLIEVNPVSRAEKEISSNLIAVNSSSALFAQPWDVAVVPSNGGQPVDTGAPAITGIDRQGQTLTASTGTWNPAATSYTYAWQRSTDKGNTWLSIAGATSASYVPVSADVGASIEVTVTATNSYGSGQATSQATATVASGAPANTAAPKVSGTPQRASVLSASTGSWSPAGTSYAYQWQTCSGSGANCRNISGQTKSTYTLQKSDEGADLQVLVTAENSFGSRQAASAPVGPVAALLAQDIKPPAISGTALRASKLTATTGTWNSVGQTYAYQWSDCDASGQNCQAIAGATSTGYTLAQSDEGHKVVFSVTASNIDAAVVATSAPSAVVASSPPANTKAPAISGTAMQGVTLTAGAGTWTGAGNTYTYQWKDCAGQTCAPIQGATGTSYTVRASDAGASIEFQVTATNVDATVVKASAPTSAVAGEAVSVQSTTSFSVPPSFLGFSFEYPLGPSVSTSSV